MTHNRFHLFLVTVTSMALAFSSHRLIADEGMWLFNQLPKRQLLEQHDFVADSQWSERLMLSAVRFNSGGSASFVSENGLVLTNHHVAADTLYKLSTAENNYHENGFLANNYLQEIPAPDLELNQLVSIQDVTDKVNGAITTAMTSNEAAKARQSIMASIEKDSLDKSGLRSDVVTLFGGGRYHLYLYKKYTDVRLVWAPESGAAFFGGDADNFEYPRYCLDVTLFRVYENGSPAKISNYLRTEPQGATDGDLIFVAGNPGRTRRIYTSDALAYQRDIAMPRMMNLLRRKENLLQQYSLAGVEEARRAKDDLFGIQNSRKAYGGMLAGLQDPSFVTSKRQSEAELTKKLASNPKLESLADAWKSIKETQARKAAMVGKSGMLKSRPYSIAETIVLMVAEDSKPSGERLRQFRDSNRESLEQELYSPAPMYPDLERTLLADELAKLMEDRGGDDPLVLTILDGKSPRMRAAEVIAATKLFDVESRKALVAGGSEAIAKSDDPLIKMAIAFEAEYRRIDAEMDEIEEVERQSYSKINQAQFAISGDTVYPDATFTLRLAFGKVKGYDVDGTPLPPATTIGGAFEHESRHQSQSPWILPRSWHAAKESIDLKTPLNFVSTADIIGGNSGSPVVNKAGKLVGVIFDGNIDSLTADFYYTDKTARAVSVHISGMLELLSKVYNAEHLVKEMIAK